MTVALKQHAIADMVAEGVRRSILREMEQSDGANQVHVVVFRPMKDERSYSPDRSVVNVTRIEAVLVNPSGGEEPIVFSSTYSEAMLGLLAPQAQDDYRTHLRHRSVLDLMVALANKIYGV